MTHPHPTDFRTAIAPRRSNHELFDNGAGPGQPPASHAVMVYWGGFLAQSNGSHARALALLNFLRERFDRVTLYSYSEHAAEPWDQAERRTFAERFPDVELVLDRETRRLRLAKKTKEWLVTLMPQRAASILARGLASEAPGFARLRRHQSAVFVVNYVDGLARLNGVPLERTVVETHDLKFLKRAHMTRSSPTSALSLVRLRNEMASLAAPAGVIAITRGEAAFFRRFLRSERVFYVPLYGATFPKGVTSAAGPAEQAPSADPSIFDYDMLFAASENPLNVRGILAFVRANAEWLGRWRIALCGRICEVPEVREQLAGMPNVALLGFVDDLPALCARTRLCLSPTDGTGLKIKLVEALRLGKPVLASAHSMEGLPPGAEACVFPAERAAAERLLEDPAALAQAMREARAFYAALSEDGDQHALGQFLAALSRPSEEFAF